MNGSFNAAFGNYIHALRKDKRITKDELAERLETSVAIISGLESGGVEVSVTLADKIAEILGVTVSQLYSGAHSIASAASKETSSLDYRNLNLDIPFYESETPVTEAELRDVLLGFNAIRSQKARTTVSKLIKHLAPQKSTAA